MKTTPDMKEVVRILKAMLPSDDYHAVLFGSRARGDEGAGADWDVGIIGPAPVRGSVMELIREELEELPTLHTFDLVDLARVPESFRETALEHTRDIL